jgi:hypothetical protein
MHEKPVHVFPVALRSGDSHLIIIPGVETAWRP